MQTRTKSIIVQEKQQKSKHPPITFPKTTEYHNVAGFAAFAKVKSMFDNYCLKLFICRFIQFFQ
jgi:hypothetical protein